LEANRASAGGRERRLIDLTATLEKVSVPAAIVDREGMVTWTNDAARNAFGNRVAQPFVSVVAPEYIALVRRQLERKLKGEPATDYKPRSSPPTARGIAPRSAQSSFPAETSVMPCSDLPCWARPFRRPPGRCD
jgi:hypothetical protein